MILPIDNQYRLIADFHCWAIQKSRPYKKSIKWESIRWYTTLEQAVNGLGRLRLRTSNVQTLAEALSEVETIYATLCQALTPHYNLEPAKRTAGAEE